MSNLALLPFFRVRWTAPEWGANKWSTRSYVSRAAAERFYEKQVQRGLEVELWETEEPVLQHRTRHVAAHPEKLTEYRQKQQTVRLKRG